MGRGTMRTGGRALGILVAVGMLLALTATPATAVTTITQVFPTTAAIGCQVTITGTEFINVTGVDFNLIVAPVGTWTVDTSTQITATVPAGATTGPIHVITAANGTGTSATFTPAPAGPLCPSVTSVNPTSGAAGQSVIVTGTNFTGATAVRFGTTLQTSVSGVTPTQLQTTVPSGASGTGLVRVYTAAGTGPSSALFSVTGGSTITSFSPTSGPVGTSVTINGTNLTGATSVTFNNVAAAAGWVVNATGTTITGAIVPASATTGPIRVVTPLGTATSTTNFTVTGAGAERTVTLNLSGHLKLSGDVNAADAACEKFVPVAIQRAKSGSGWKTLSLLSTSDDGHFKGFAPNKSGKYRARAKAITLVNGVACAADNSPVRKYTA